jgi:preprotein translocase subunit SecB
MSASDTPVAPTGTPASSEAARTANGQNSPGADDSQNIQFEVNGQYIKDFSFESPNSPDCFMTPTQPKMDVQVDVQARGLGNSVFEVALRVQSRASREIQTVFVLDLTYAGLFTLRNVQPEQIQPLLLIECPRLLFPFARNIVADATRDGGFPPLLLQPIDFVGLYRSQLESASGQTQGSTAEATPVSERPKKARS